MGWKWGCQPFQLHMFAKREALPKKVYATCLSKESMPFVKSKLPTPYQKLKVPESGSTLHQLILVAYFLQKIELWYPRCRLQDIDFDLGCLMQVSFLPLWVGSRAASLSMFIFWGIPSIHPPTRSFRFHKLCVMAASSPSLHYSQEFLHCVPM